MKVKNKIQDAPPDSDLHQNYRVSFLTCSTTLHHVSSSIAKSITAACYHDLISSLPKALQLLLFLLK